MNMMAYKSWLKRLIGESRGYQAVHRLRNKMAWDLRLFWPQLRIAWPEEEARRKLLSLWTPRTEIPKAAKRWENPSDLDLSIIVPVYNTGQYLRECLDSVLDQELPATWELLIVDDGSTDHSAQILKEYEGREHIRIFRKENGGLSSARNLGLQKSRGNYVMFLDSDDYLTEGSLGRIWMCAKRENADIVQMGYEKLLGEKRIPAAARIPFQSTQEYAQMLKIPGHACMKLFAKHLFDDIEFPEGYWYEDTIMHLLVFERCRKMAVSAKTSYIYRQNLAGITYSRKKSMKCLETYWIIPYVLKMREQVGMQMNAQVYRSVLYHLSGICYSRLVHLGPEVLKAVFILSAGCIERLREDGDFEDALNERERFLERTFLEHDFGRWQNFCRYADKRM